VKTQGYVRKKDLKMSLVRMLAYHVASRSERRSGVAVRALDARSSGGSSPERGHCVYSRSASLHPDV